MQIKEEGEMRNKEEGGGVQYRLRREQCECCGERKMGTREEGVV